MQTKESIASPTRKASKAMAAIQTEITLLAIDATTSKNQKALAKVATLRHGGDRKSEDIKGSKDTLIDDTKSIAEAAAQMKVSPASVKRAKKVHSKGSESTKKALADGSLPVTTAALHPLCATLPPERLTLSPSVQVR